MIFNKKSAINTAVIYARVSLKRRRPGITRQAGDADTLPPNGKKISIAKLILTVVDLGLKLERKDPVSHLNSGHI